MRLTGGIFLLLGLIFLLAWLFNRADARAFAEGVRAEGTVVQIWEDEYPTVEIEFVDSNGRMVLKDGSSKCIHDKTTSLVCFAATSCWWGW